MSTSVAQHGPGFVSPLEAMKHGSREKILYVSLVNYDGTKPDCLATVDVDVDSPTCGKVIHTLDMPYPSDELHHFGWNTCSSCCDDPSKVRRFLILPGQRTSRIYIVDTIDERAPKIHKIIEPEEILTKCNLTAPHTVHCLPDGHIMISMLGDGLLKAPGGFLVLKSDFSVLGRWNECEETKMRFNHDFWYQPAHNVMVSSEFASPEVYLSGFKWSDVKEGKYGSGVCFWNWEEKKLVERVDLGDEVQVSLAARFLHNPKSSHGFFVSAMSGNICHFFLDFAKSWQVKKAVHLKVKSVSDTPVPPFTSDIVISLDDRFMYVSNWFHGDIHQYDITIPSEPKLVGQVTCGASYQHAAGEKVAAQRSEFHKLEAGPHMMQLSLDGKRLYVTNSFLSVWDDQFYPKLGPQGSAMIRINVDTDKGGLEIDESFFIDFGNVNNNKYRAHEMRYPGGDCTSDIWLDKDSREQ